MKKINLCFYCNNLTIEKNHRHCSKYKKVKKELHPLDRISEFRAKRTSCSYFKLKAWLTQKNNNKNLFKCYYCINYRYVTDKKSIPNLPISTYCEQKNTDVPKNDCSDFKLPNEITDKKKKKIMTREKIQVTFTYSEINDLRNALIGAQRANENLLSVKDDDFLLAYGKYCRDAYKKLFKKIDTINKEIKTEEAK